MTKVVNYSKKVLKRLLKLVKQNKARAEDTTPIQTRDQWPLDERIKGAMSLFEQKQGYSFDISNPELFTEKIIWYKLFYTRNDLVRIVDKYLFKDYIEERLGKGYTIPLIGVWDNIEDLEKDWDDLPEEFCIKSTLQSDGYCIKMIHEKSKNAFTDIKSQFASWLKPEKTLINSFCRAYYGAKPRIIAEEYKTEVNGQLYDYKVFCFNGEPVYVYVATDHFPEQLSHISFYDLKWKRLDVRYGEHPNCDVQKPENLDEMLNISRKLSDGFPFIRVDFFNTKEKVYVAELTLYPGGGQTPIYPESFNKELGDRFVLPTIAAMEQ